MEDIKEKLLKIANEKVNEKLEKEREENEEKIKSEIEQVNIILELIEKKMLYKVTNNNRGCQKFIMITKDIFFEDYTSEPEYEYDKGIKLKDYDYFSTDNYRVNIDVNGIKYSHIGFIIQEFEDELKNKINRINYMTEGLSDLETEFNELKNQESNIKKFIQDYNETKDKILEV